MCRTGFLASSQLLPSKQKDGNRAPDGATIPTDWIVIMVDVQSSYPSEADVTRIAAIEDAPERNRQITEAYWRLSTELERRILGHANWCTFATWASQQAGVTIRHEDVTDLLREQLQSAWKVTGLEAKLIELLEEGNLDLLQLVVNAIADLGPIKRSGDAVGHGNRKVFEEIGLLFARWLTLFPDIGSIHDADVASFCQSLKPGPPPHGQDVLKQAFRNYRAAAVSTDAKEKAQLMFLANLQIGFHEQTRLQPDIQAALDGALLEPGDLTDLLMETLTGHEGRVAKTLEKVWHSQESPLRKVTTGLAHDVQGQVRTLITAQLMSLWLPPGKVVQLGRDVGHPFPEALQTLTSPELLKLLAGFDPTPGSESGSGVRDWANLQQRLRFIADLFRAYGMEKCLFDPLKGDTTVCAQQAV